MWNSLLILYGHLIIFPKKNDMNVRCVLGDADSAHHPRHFRYNKLSLYLYFDFPALYAFVHPQAHTKVFLISTGKIIQIVLPLLL